MKTYWEGTGKFQKVYDLLYKKLVPAVGEASTTHGELLRQVSKIYYDIYNNGFCNADVLAQNALDVFSRFEELIKNQLDDEKVYYNVVDTIKKIKEIQFQREEEDSEIPTKEIVDNLINSVDLERFVDAVIDVVTAYDMGYIKTGKKQRRTK